MKKLLTLLLVVVFTASCTKDATTDQQDELLSIALSGQNANITLSPSDDLSGATDADAIETAIADLPPGGLLLLDKGTFYINRTIVAPDGFNGTIRGKKMSLTEVIGVGDGTTPFDVFDGSYSALYFPNPQGSVSVSNMSITLAAGFTAIGWPIPGVEVDLTLQFLATFINVDLGDDKTDTNFDDLRLTGTSIPPPPISTITPFTPRLGILVSTGDFFSSELPFSIGGQHVVTKSEISKIGIFPTWHQKMQKSSIEISKNSFFDIAQIHTQWLDGCNVSISNNDIEANSIGAIVVTQEGQPIEGANSNVEIKGNKVSTNGLFPIEIGPISGSAGFNLIIKNNQLTSSGPDPFLGLPQEAGIAVFAGNHNADVKDNVIIGNANYGIWQESDNGSFKDNDITNFNANLFDYLLKGDNNELKGIGNSTVDDQGAGNIIKN